MAKLLTDRTNRIDAWLAQGGLVIAANDRAARSIALAFDAARRAEGRAAWPTPAIQSWESWVRERWLERDSDGLVLLNSLQERALWTRVIAKRHVDLPHPDRLATQAQRAYRLLSIYAPDALKTGARQGWAGDAAVFSEWVGEFEAICGREGLTSGSCLPLLLTVSLRQEAGDERKPLLLVGFDRLLETQKGLLDSWGSWQLDLPGTPADSARFFAAQDEDEELAACAGWLRRRLTFNPDARLVVVTTALDERRGSIERALMQRVEAENGAGELEFEFSLGVPLAQVGLVRGALLLLRWLSGTLSESELDWLISSGYTSSNAEDDVALAEVMRELRRRGMERTEWALDAFLGPEMLVEPEESIFAADFGDRRPPRPPAEWSARLLAARNLLQQAPPRQGPMEWATLASELLTAVGWPGFKPLGSAAFQARKSWEEALEACASLGFDGREMDWAGFLSAATEAVAGTIFATESTNPAILITEPIESAGQLADGIWFLGVNESDWPGRGALHPLLPVALQREAGMPHSTPLEDWELADAATARLLASAGEVFFSYSRMVAEGEARPSRLIAQRVGEPVALPEEFGRRKAREPRAEAFDDLNRIPFPLETIDGGSATLTSQSLCPFQAFAAARLSAQDSEPAEAGLNARQRGQLLHAVLHRVWSGTPRGGIGTLADLRGLVDVEGFVTKCVRWVLDNKTPKTLRETLPARFLELEAKRLTRLVTVWLAYERERQPFSVAATEVKSTVKVAGLTMRLRLDRVDIVDDGTMLVIDYKSGAVSPKAWDGDRPDDVQLPLYATFAALGEQVEQVDERVQGLVFARVKPGDLQFYGRVRDAAGKLRGDLGRQTGLVKNPLTDEQLADWRGVIQRLGEEFLNGKADVTPKDGLKTCEHCHLQAVCRIYENQSLAALEDDDEETEGDNA